jgi:hypothetical protein
MKAKIFTIALLVTFLAASRFAFAQYDIPWWTIDGGGGLSSGGSLLIQGSIGQPDSGFMSGGNFTVSGGFWGILSIPSSGAPPLRISRIGHGAVAVSWPKPAGGWLLEQTASLNPPISWAHVTAAVVQTNEAEIYVIVSPPAGNHFYRLRKP